MNLLILLLTLAAPPQAPPVRERPPQAPPVAPEVAPARARTFQRERYNPSHRCENCGRSQFVISGWVGNGQHRHTCSACGLSWVH
jgi:hypothetical protein